MSPTRRQRIRRRCLVRLAGAAALLVLLATVFALYTQPEFMVMQADQVWACF